MTAPALDASDGSNRSFSLVQGRPLFRIQQRLGLIPGWGLGIPQHRIFFTLLITAEAVAQAISRRIFPCFITSGLFTEAMISRFVESRRQAVRLRDSWLMAAVMVVLAVLAGMALHGSRRGAARGRTVMGPQW